MAITVWTGSISGDWSVSGNWSNGVPASSDNVWLTNNSVSITAGLSQSAVTLATLIIDSTYTGLIGTSTSFLAISATNLNIGANGPTGTQGSNSTRVNINLGSNASTVTVLSSASSSADSGEPPIRLLGTVITLNAISGSVGIGTEASDTATATAITTVGGQSSGPTIYTGYNTTVTTWNVGSGTVTDASKNSSTTMTISGGGRITKTGTGAITTLNVQNGGSFLHNSTGTVTTANIVGTFDSSGDGRAKTITNCNLYSGGRIIAPLVVFTNGIVLVACKISQTTIDVGTGRTLGIT